MSQLLDTVGSNLPFIHEVNPNDLSLAVVQKAIVSEPLEISVREVDYNVDTGLIIKRGQRVVLSAYGEIWAGV